MHILFNNDENFWTEHEIKELSKENIMSKIIKYLRNHLKKQ